MDYEEIMKGLCIDFGRIMDRFWRGFRRDYGMILEGL